MLPIYPPDSSILRCIYVNSQTKWSMPKIKHTMSNTLHCSSFPPNNFSLSSVRNIEENTFYTKLRIHNHVTENRYPIFVHIVPKCSGNEILAFNAIV